MGVYLRRITNAIMKQEMTVPAKAYSNKEPRFLKKCLCRERERGAIKSDRKKEEKKKRKKGEKGKKRRKKRKKWSCFYRTVPSKCLHVFPCKHPPPFLMTLWFGGVPVYVQMVLRTVQAPTPGVLAHVLQAPMGTYSEQYSMRSMTHYCVCTDSVG